MLNLKKNGKWSLLGIIIFSLSLNIIYLQELKNTPLYSQLVVDEQGYFEKATLIVSKGWLGDQIFYQDPLYPYFLALSIKFFGDSLTIIRLIQIFFSLGSIFLIYKISAELFDKKTAIAAGFIASLYGTFTYYNGLIEKVTLSIFFTSLLLYLLQKAQKSLSGTKLLGAGLLLGACSLLRGNYLLLLPIISLWILLITPEKSVKFKNLSLFCLGFFLVISPVTLRNYLIGDDFVLTTSQAGANFYIGNNLSAKGNYTGLPFVRATPEYEEVDFGNHAQKMTGRKLTPSEISRYWFLESIKSIKQNPLFHLKLFINKLLLSFNKYEIPDNRSFYVTRQMIPVLKFCFITFGILLPISVLGICLNENRGALRFWIFYLFLGTYLLSLVLFFVTARYRIPMAPALIPFGAYFITSGWKRVLYLKNKMTFFLFIVLVLFVVNRPSGIFLEPMAYYNIGSSYDFKKEHVKAAEYLSKSIEMNYNFAPAHNNIGIVFKERGDYKKALHHFKEALRIDPGLADASFNLGLVLKKMGNLQEAALQFEKTVKINTNYFKAYNSLGLIFFEQGKINEAIPYYKKALSVNPGNSDTLYNLAMAFFKLKKVDEALSNMNAALKINPTDIKIHAFLGYIYLNSGNFSKAIVHFSEILKLDPNNAGAHYNLGLAFKQKGMINEGENEIKRALRIDPELLRSK